MELSPVENAPINFVVIANGAIGRQTAGDRSECVGMVDFVRLPIIRIGFSCRLIIAVWLS